MTTSLGALATALGSSTATLQRPRLIEAIPAQLSPPPLDLVQEGAVPYEESLPTEEQQSS